jgi:endonuclease YncB( thermonuclease family)
VIIMLPAMKPRSSTLQTWGFVVLCASLAACAGRQPQHASATAGAALVRNSIDIGIVKTTFFVVDSVDGAKVHEKLDFKRQVEIAAGRRELRVTHYTDALWGSRESSETCTIVVDAEPNGIYEIEGEAERDEWRARLVNRQTSRVSPCLFPDEPGVGTIVFDDRKQAEATSPPPPGGETAPSDGRPSAMLPMPRPASGNEPGVTDSAVAPTEQPARRKSFCGRGFYRVAHLDGGATFVLERSDRVRLIGVEPDVTGATPPGSDAAGIEGACVRFDYEPTNLIDGHRDRDGRLLAYVYLQDGTFVNVEWIRAGRVRASNERHQHMAEFLAAQSLARRAGVGVWGR